MVPLYNSSHLLKRSLPPIPPPFPCTLDAIYFAMSGLNPFRRRRSEGEIQIPVASGAPWWGAPIIDQEETRATSLPLRRHCIGVLKLMIPDVAGPPSSSSSITTNFTSPEIISSAAAESNLPQKPNGLAATPHTADDDDSTSSDNQSMTDPFNHCAYLSDHDSQDRNLGQERWSSSQRPSPDDPPRAPARTAKNVRESLLADPRNPGKNLMTPDAMISAKSDVLVRSLPSSHAGSHTASSSSTDVSQPTTHTGTAGRPVADQLSEMDKESQGLNRRTGDKDKRPPPPPRSHHGKLINPNPVTTLPLQRQMSIDSTSRLSFQGPSTESSFSHQPGNLSQSSIYAQTSMDPTGLAENRPAWPTELRRSQSQYKRPPTPPLSRRQSQMRRSKTTYSKTSSTQLGVAPGDMEANALAGADRASITSQKRESRSSTPQSVETTFRPSPSYEESPVLSTLSRMSSMKAAKRASYTSSQAPAAVPPPPPPRRTRVSSNNSNDSNRQRIVPSERNAPHEGDFIPHPSNASDILADLSRLQKEVDDLRGHYESRKVSQ